jgi:hypothetical protein
MITCISGSVKGLNIAIVGGTFDFFTGKPSGVVEKIFEAFSNTSDKFYYKNGGNYYKLLHNIQKVSADIVLWFPNVDNRHSKFNIKSVFPNSIVVTSKRNDNNKYNMHQIVNHALGLKSNLVLEFSVSDNRVYGRVIDPLGVVWCDYTDNINEWVRVISTRARFLNKMTRVGSKCVSSLPAEIPNNDEFFEIVRKFGDRFFELVIPDKDVKRFLGNASFKFRCNKGFPSFRSDNNYIFVSKRNIDKQNIDRDGFVHVADGWEVAYAGNSKPSVDTPVQLRLYDYFKEVNYMIHSHTYIKDAPFTSRAIPCGAIEEFYEIEKVAYNNKYNYNFCVNQIGHGSIILAKDLDYFNQVEHYARPVPEILKVEDHF